GIAFSRATTAISTPSARCRSSRNCSRPDPDKRSADGGRPPAASQRTEPMKRSKPARRGASRADAAAPRVVILAGGIGSGMRSSLPRVLHRVAGRTLLEAVLDAAAGLSPSAVVVVVGKEGARVEASLEGRGARFARQDPPLGTGDAAARAL